MNYVGKRVGIWGFGTTGKSLLKFFTHRHAIIEIFDNRTLSTQEQHSIIASGACLRSRQDFDSFLCDNTYIVPSQGIDIRPYRARAHYIAEVDLFAHYYTKPYIAITGSCGKTTVTTLLSRLLTTGIIHMPACGNIGLPMLDILEQSADGAVVELSSTQLEFSMQIAPDLAIVTNLHPNHLDRHDSIQEYYAAKMNIIRYQKSGQRALLPLGIYTQLPAKLAQRSDYAFFTPQKPSVRDYALLRPDQSLYYMDNSTIMCYQAGKQQLIYSSPAFATITYPENWLIITAALDLLNIPPTRIDLMYEQLTIPDHRLVHVGSVCGVDFYNDSKATIPASTLAAVHQLQPKSIILLLGGMSKGVNRQQLIQKLAGQVKYILCFGAEAQQLVAWCHENLIPSTAHVTLEAAFAHCLTLMHPRDIVLFSPAGASFDLFGNYVQRGERFKELVEQEKNRV